MVRCHFAEQIDASSWIPHGRYCPARAQTKDDGQAVPTIMEVTDLKKYYKVVGNSLPRCFGFIRTALCKGSGECFVFYP
ncbi:MAG UNVERIFIED_CONTAM: hypothetical protein LVR29_25865 [Microcystis novacekii LVE1205-3]